MIFYLLQLGLCTTVGIDLGSDTIKVAVGSPMVPVHLVRNLYSHELIPTYFIYKDRSHWDFGDAAVDQCLLHPDKCLTSLPFDNKLYFNELRGYEIVALSMMQILSVVKKVEQINDKIKVIIAIPPSMTCQEKSYLYNALTIAQIDCIQFVTTTYAPIELFVAEKRYGFFQRSAIFVDIGHSGTRLSAFDFTENKIEQKFSQFNDNIGGKTIDENLFKIAVSRFRLGAYSDKDRLLLLREIRKAKETLTIQQSVSFYFKDKTIKLTRQDVENSCLEITKALDLMISNLKQNRKIENVYILGGCTRIPYLQTYLNQQLRTTVQKVLDINSAVSMGACYKASFDVSTNVKERDPLISSEIILKSEGNVYKLFNYGNSENANPAILVKTRPLQLFQVFDKSDDKEFMRFTINNGGYNDVDIGFTLNYYLMPVPDPPIINGRQGAVEYERVGWEISQSELQGSQRVVQEMISKINHRFQSEMKSNLIEAYKLKVEKMLKKYGFLNWRRFAVQGIYMYIDYQYTQCVEKGCSEIEEDNIVKQFKDMIYYIIEESHENDLNNNNKKEKDEIKNILRDHSLPQHRRKLIQELSSMLEACRAAGADIKDIEKSISGRLKTASDEEINTYIGMLREIARSRQSYTEYL